MKKFLKYLVCIIAVFSVFSCGDKHDPGIMNLSTKSLTFESYSSQQTVHSRGQGMYVDAIIIDNKEVSDRMSDRDGSLILESEWVQVVTPGFKSGQAASNMVVRVRGNNTDSDRECHILVHNGGEKEKIKVTQHAEKTDKE